MNLIKICLISLISINLICVAEDSVPLDQGQKAPFSGVLLSPSKAQEFKNTLVERDTLKLLNTSLNNSLNLQNDIIERKDTQIKLVLDQNDSLAKNLNNERSMSNWERIGIFGLGALITVLVLYGVQRVH